MKVLISTFSFPPEKDGVAEASATCAHIFRQKGWSVEVATSRTASSPRSSVDWQGFCGHEFAISGTPHFRKSYQGPLQLYRDFLLSGRWDVIFFQGYSWPLDLAAPLLNRLSAKKVLVSHGYGALIWTPVPRFPFGLGALAFSAARSLRMLRWIKKIDRWVFLSPQTDFRSFYDHWLAQKIHHPGIRVIPNGLDPARRGMGSRFRDALGIPKDVLVVLCVGYFSRGKNQRLALEAYRDAALPNSRLIFIAPESNDWMDLCRNIARHIRWLAADMGVLWLTGQSRESTLDAFAGCDIYLSASTGETQPISILEAMRESKPWIAMRAGCISEFPGGVCVSSLQEMVSALRRLAAQPKERDHLGQAGRQAVESKYSTECLDTAYSQLVKQLASEGK